MSPALSAYLDIARLMAAFVVFSSHVQHHAAPAFWWRFSSLGSSAVAVFFVLSGFVIAHTVQNRATTAKAYAIDRIARMASVALPALALTYILQGGHGPGFGISELIRSLTFTNEAWGHVSWGNNLPYWSLGFEVPYYVIFGILTFAPRSSGLLASAILLALIGPAVALLFPLWWLGFLTHRFCSRHVLPAGIAIVLLLSPALIAATGVPEPIHGEFETMNLSPARLLEIVRDYYVGFLFALNVMGFNRLFGRIKVPEMLGKSVRWLAGATFSLYLFHLPLLIAFASVWPYSPADWRSTIILPCLVVAVVYLLAEFTERRRRFWRRIVERCFAAFSRPRTRIDVSP
jgi:peptidoglycan/LPS O-acetylase OafA/YrhL